MIATGIFSLVTSKSAITDIIGTNPTRLYPKVLPQGLSTFPAMAYQIVSITGNPNFDGASKLDFNRMDFHFYGQSDGAYLDIESLANTFRSQIEDTKGTFGGLDIANIRFIDASDDYLEETEKYTISAEYQLSTHR